MDWLGPARWRPDLGAMLRTDHVLISPTRGGRIVLSEWRPEHWERQHWERQHGERQRGGGSGGSSGGGGGDGGSDNKELEPPPALVYVHGNAGARVDVTANGLLPLCAARGWALVAFDCGGSGLSDGDQVPKRTRSRQKGLLCTLVFVLAASFKKPQAPQCLRVVVVLARSENKVRLWCR